MKVRPIFHIGLLKDFISLIPNTEVPDDIPTSNELIYGDDHYHVHSLLDKKMYHTLKPTQKVFPFCFGIDGKDATIRRIIGSYILMSKQRIVLTTKHKQ